MLRKLGEGNGIALRRFITDLNLSLGLVITTPLNDCNGIGKWKIYCSTENVTNTDTYLRCSLGTKWRGILCIQEGMASASDGYFERKTKSPVRVQEKDGHLQFRILDVVFSIGNVVRNPQGLRNRSSDTHNATIEHPSVLVGILNSDIFRNRGNDERAALCPREIWSRNCVPLQNIKEVLLSLLRTEALGYIPVDQKL